MSNKRNARNVLVALGVAAAVIPAAVSDAKPGPKQHAAKHHAKSEKGAKQANYLFKGTFHLASGTVTVTKGNHAVKRAGLIGTDVAFDLSAARVKVADANGDGRRDLADIRDGDKVVVQARLARREPGAGPFAARRLVDQTHSQEADDDQDAEAREDDDQA